VLVALRDIVTTAKNQRGSAVDGFDMFNRYLQWSNDSVRRLGGVLRPSDVDRLVLTRRHWAIQGMDPATQPNTLYSVVSLEIEERERDLESAIAQVDKLLERWRKRSGVVIVPDTNVLLHFRQQLEEADWRGQVEDAWRGVHVVLPVLVIDELDDQKRTGKKPETRTRARTTLRELETRLTKPDDVAVLQPATSDAEAVTVEFFLDDPHHQRLPRADDELVDRAAAIRDVTGHDVVVLSYDYGTRLRARHAGVEGREPIEPEGL
jgi:rRNA-processing protein FCF1